MLNDRSRRPLRVTLWVALALAVTWVLLGLWAVSRMGPDPEFSPSDMTIVETTVLDADQTIDD